MAATEPKQEGGGKSILEELKESAPDAAKELDSPKSVTTSKDGPGDPKNMRLDQQKEANSIRSKLLHEREFCLQVQTAYS